MRLIDIENATLSWSKEDTAAYGNDFSGGVLFALDKLTEEAMEVVLCKDCERNGFCVKQDGFRNLGIENPFCCAGKRKAGT